MRVQTGGFSAGFCVEPPLFDSLSGAMASGKLGVVRSCAGCQEPDQKLRYAIRKRPVGSLGE